MASESAVKKISPEAFLEAGSKCREMLSERKAEDVKFLDLRKVSSYLDYFLICTASSRLQSRALQKHAEQLLASLGIHAVSNTDNDGEWCIIDAGSLVVHIFTKEGRDFYSLDRLWGDAAAR